MDKREEERTLLVEEDPEAVLGLVLLELREGDELGHGRRGGGQEKGRREDKAGREQLA